VWHVATEFDACSWRVAAEILGDPCSRCNVWHGTDSCAVTIHPFDLDNIPHSPTRARCPVCKSSSTAE
jgi:hypothetical protein